MGSITFAAVAKCLIPLNFPSSIVALQLNPWLLHTMSSPIPRASAACGAPGSTAGLHLPCCPVPSRAQTAFDFLKWECLESPRQEERDALGHCLGKELEGVCVPWKRPGGFTDLLQVSQSCLHPEGVPKHILTPMEGWYGGQERFGGY